MTCFDAHSDIWTDVTARRLKGETDVLRKHHLDRLRKGGVEGSIFVIWVDPPYERDYPARTRQIMDCVTAEIAACDGIRVVRTYEEMLRAKADGKFYVFIGVEGMAAVGTDLGKIDGYYDLGARHGMLTWNEENALGAGANSGVTTGLTDLGKAAVRKMREKRMLLDVSHLNEAGFWDLVKLADAPIIASHSNCKALCDVPRNLTDDQLRAIRDLNGVVGLNAYKGFVDPDPANWTVEGLARQAAHMIDVMGIDHVGFGFDFFEFLDDYVANSVPEEGNPALAGLSDATEIPNLLKCFEGMGLRQEEIEKIAYGNFQRAIREAVG